MTDRGSRSEAPGLEGLARFIDLQKTREQLRLDGWTIHYRLLIRVRNSTKADRKLEETRRTLRRQSEVTTSVRYWKDEGLWECGLRVADVRGSPAEVAFECLVLAARLGNGWYLLGPGANGELQIFEGVFDVHRGGSTPIVGLEWASFSMNAPA